MRNKRQRAPTIGRDLVFALAAGAAVYLASSIWTSSGNAPVATAIAPWMDFAIVAYGALLLSMMQNRAVGALFVVTVPVALFIIGGTLVLELFNEPLSLSYLFLIDEGVAFYHAELIAGFGAIAYCAVFVLNLRAPGRYFMWALVPLIIIGGMLGLKGALESRDSENGGQNIHWWHGYDFSASAGYFTGFILDALVHFERQELYRQLLADNPGQSIDDFLSAKLSETTGTHRSVHLILVESLIDPTRNKESKFSRDPFSPQFRTWVDGQGGFALSPVFGARSPDTEFEILCGIPATLDGSQVVMAELKVASLDCLPRKLARLGWKTLATQPIAPQIFKTAKAYDILGFAESRFSPDLDMSDTDIGQFTSNMGAVTALETLSSDSLLRQNMEALGPDLKSGKRVFNYVFMTGGHYPFGLDETKRPQVVSATPASDIYTRYVNAVYYNTLALERYVQDVFDLDPTALIVILGDHGPPLGEAVRVTADGRAGTWSVETLRHRVPLVMLEGARTYSTTLPTVPAYLLPELILDRLTNGEFCQANICRRNSPEIMRPLEEKVLVYDQTGKQVRECTGQTADCADAMAFTNQNKLRLLQLIYPKAK